MVPQNNPDIGNGHSRYQHSERLERNDDTLRRLVLDAVEHAREESRKVLTEDSGGKSDQHVRTGDDIAVGVYLMGTIDTK